MLFKHTHSFLGTLRRARAAAEVGVRELVEALRELRVDGAALERRADELLEPVAERVERPPRLGSQGTEESVQLNIQLVLPFSLVKYTGYSCS